MCSGSEVPVSGSMPTAWAKRNTTWAGVARRRAAMPAISGVAQHLGVGGEQREALVDDAALRAERAHVAVPAAAGVAAVLHERRRLGAADRHLLELPQRDVADAEQPRPAGVALAAPSPARPRRPRRSSRRPRRGRAARSSRRGRSRGARASWRTTARPAWPIGRGVVGQAVVLAVQVGELGLQEQLGARHHARA